ncbi:MAG: N-6 DNA methylase [Caldilineaceae bacterium]
MQSLNLKTNSAVVNAYYNELGNLSQLMLLHEGAVSPAFAALLRACGSQVGWTLAEQYSLRVSRTDESGRKQRIRLDGALLDDYKLVQGIWEAKDTDDDLEAEIRAKFAKGYPRDNILFQAPERAVLYQDGRPVFTADLTDSRQLVDILKAFFNYRPPAYEQWHRAVEEFKGTVPDLAARLLELIEEEERRSRRFQDALANFIEICRGTINPNISKAAVREMLIQHLLTERIFRRVFDNSDFAQRNVIAREIETVIQALTAQHFSRHSFLASLDRFYGAIEATAATIDDFSQKQDFLNTVYENFFQGFSVKVADTHGIVYTPQPIVDFMVRSVDVLLKQEFGRSLGAPDVHVLDPFVGTGNFILRVMHEIPRTRLEQKYATKLHCNEVMLLPYYIAAMNIEHAFYELTGTYQPFEGICLADTFELGTGHAAQPGLFAPQNSERVAHQQAADITVIIGNPPYNAWQLNENDNNKNRSYPLLDKRVSETYAKASAATNKNALSDPYVKAFRWAADRIGDEGIIAFVSNNSFVDALSFDGMRKQLGEEFDAIYVLDLGGNVRQNPKLSGTTHNIFGIQVGVAVTLLVKRGERTDAPKIFYARTDEYWRKGEKYDFLEQTQTVQGIKWQEITPNARHTWLTSETEGEFYTGIPIGEKENGSLCVSRIWPRCCQFDCLPPDVNLAKYAPSSQRSLESI